MRRSKLCPEPFGERTLTKVLDRILLHDNKKATTRVGPMFLLDHNLSSPNSEIIFPTSQETLIKYLNTRLSQARQQQSYKDQLHTCWVMEFWVSFMAAALLSTSRKCPRDGGFLITSVQCLEQQWENSHGFLDFKGSSLLPLLIDLLESSRMFETPIRLPNEANTDKEANLEIRHWAFQSSFFLRTVNIKTFCIVLIPHTSVSKSDEKSVEKVEEEFKSTQFSISGVANPEANPLPVTTKSRSNQKKKGKKCESESWKRQFNKHLGAMQATQIKKKNALSVSEEGKRCLALLLAFVIVSSGMETISSVYNPALVNTPNHIQN
ncbi:hypothetical protein V2J09_018177 [Rumex salicifolius]